MRSQRRKPFRQFQSHGVLCLAWVVSTPWIPLRGLSVLHPTTSSILRPHGPSSTLSRRALTQYKTMEASMFEGLLRQWLPDCKSTAREYTLSELQEPARRLRHTV